MDPQEFCDLADWLTKCSCPHSEASHRSIISRAYYSCFLKIQKIISQTYNIPIRNIEHKHVPQYLRNASDDNLNELAHDMDELKDWRKSADYFVWEKFPEDRPQNAVNSAKRILAKTRRITSAQWMSMEKHINTHLGRG